MDQIDNWQGPGIYRHYKGGEYIAVGLTRAEHDKSLHVAYTTTDADKRKDPFYSGVMFITRPLNEEDGPDCWNTLVPSPNFPPDFVPRFKLVALYGSSGSGMLIP